MDKIKTTQLKLDPVATALLVIDLQTGIVSREVAPHSGPDVVDQSARSTKLV